LSQDDGLDKIDPRGFIHQDIKVIRKHLPRLGYQKGDTLEDVAYRQGYHDLLLYIETKIIGRR
jgi:hypothetical protein